MSSIDIKQLKKTLIDVGARWESHDAVEEHGLGYTPGPGDHSLVEREGIALANHKQFMAFSAVVAPAYPASLDWRNHNGNFVTPIKDQKNCGSCVAFGSCATVEANVEIKQHKPGLGLNLSEAHLFYCHVPGIPPGSCSGGWYPDAALNVFQKRGVVDEKCFPYTPGDQPCKVCEDWQKRLTKISGWHKITATADMKNWIAKYGPVASCFTVYADFFAYKTGVYHHVSGAVQGGHCISVVGYDDVTRC
jgi:C1A family cysteine protease